MHPSGEQFEIASGDQRACAVEVGGGLRTYTAAGRAVIDGYALDATCTSARGQVLVPWPNRIAEGSYEWDGVQRQLPITEPGTGAAIHGLVRWSNWRPLEHLRDRITLEHVLHPQPGYPFALRLQVEYSLSEDGLTVQTAAENVGAEACPFGLGHHPYLAASPTVDTLVVRVQAHEPGDLREARALGDLQLDTTYVRLDRHADGLARVFVDDTVVWMDGAFDYVQLFTGDPLPDVARRALAVEPMTCPPNAFRTGEGLLRLEPGERFVARWGIQPN